MFRQWYDTYKRNQLGKPNYFSAVAKPNFEKLWKNSDQGGTSFNCLQIGAYCGDATFWMLKNRSSRRRKPLVVDVDTWLGSDEIEHKSFQWQTLEDFYDLRFRREVKSASLIKKKTTSDKFFESNTTLFDFIYVDGSHESEQVQKDAENAFKFLKLGGIIAFDDYLWGKDLPAHLTPRNAIDSFLREHESVIELLEFNYQVWIRKTTFS